MKRSFGFFTAMKLLQIIILTFVSLIPVDLLAQDPFITTWEVTDDDLIINISTVGGIGTPDFDVDWGDGSSDTNVSSASHTYTTAGAYTVSVSGDLPTFILSSADTEQLKTIEQWGDTQWLSFIQAYDGASNLQINATDVPDLSRVQDMSRAFANCRSLTGNLGDWNVSNVTDMNFMFSNSNFNGDISNWDVSNVTNMRAMFAFDTVFNQDISGWDVNSVTDFSFMFQIATAFDQNLGDWDVSNATNLDEVVNASGLSRPNYDSLLFGWSSLASLPSGTNFVGSDLKYCLGKEARQTLIDDFQWSFTNDVFDCNDDSNDIILSNNTIDEGLPVRSFIGSLTSEDLFPDQPNTYIISSAENAFAFTDMNGVNTVDSLFSELVFDFETKNSFDITIISLDSGTRIEKDFTILINDGNEAPTGITNDLDPTSNFIVVEENTTEGTVVATLSTTDENASDTHTYTVTGDDFMALRVEGNNIVMDSVLNFELLTTTSDEITVTTTDNAGGSFSRMMFLGVTDVNDGPSDIMLDVSSISENGSVGVVIGQLSTTDEDAVDALQHSYSLSGDDAEFFGLVGSFLNGQISFDFERRSSYSVNVTATDLAGASFTKEITVTIQDINDTPTGVSFPVATVAESLTPGAVLGSFATIDQDAEDSHTYAFGEVTSSAVSITANNLILNEELDYASNTEIQFTVTSTDAGGATVDSLFTLAIDAQPIATDVADLELNDDEPSQALDLDAIFSDPGGDDLSYTFLPATNDFFDVILETSTLTFDNPVTFGSVEINVMASDSLSQEAEVTFTAAYVEIVLNASNEQLDLEIFPNPATSEVQLVTGDMISLVELVDAQGRSYPVTPRINQRGIRISLAQIPPGLYVLWFELGNERFSKKLIKN